MSTIELHYLRCDLIDSCLRYFRCDGGLDIDLVIWSAIYNAICCTLKHLSYAFLLFYDIVTVIDLGLLFLSCFFAGFIEVIYFYGWFRLLRSSFLFIYFSSMCEIIFGSLRLSDSIFYRVEHYTFWSILNSSFFLHRLYCWDSIYFLVEYDLLSIIPWLIIKV